jgi:hypothetical protein
MSIASNSYADYANDVKRRWVKKLVKAVDPLRCDEINIEEIIKVITEINDFNFSE